MINLRLHGSNGRRCVSQKKEGGWESRMLTVSTWLCWANGNGAYSKTIKSYGLKCWNQSTEVGGV